MAFKTEFEFTLPKGFVDEHGNLHRKGVMRLATAKDEIIPLQDFRVKNNRAYLVIILLSRVITRKCRLLTAATPGTVMIASIRSEIRNEVRRSMLVSS